MCKAPIASEGYKELLDIMAEIIAYDLMKKMDTKSKGGAND